MQKTIEQALSDMEAFNEKMQKKRERHIKILKDMKDKQLDKEDMRLIVKILIELMED